MVQRAENIRTPRNNNVPPSSTREVPVIFYFICTHMVPPLSAHNPTAAVMNGTKGIIQRRKMADEGNVVASKEISSHYKTLPPPPTLTPTLSSSHQELWNNLTPFCPRVSSISELTNSVFLVVKSGKKRVSVFLEGCGNQLFPPSSQQGQRVLLGISVHSCQVLTKPSGWSP